MSILDVLNYEENKGVKEEFFPGVTVGVVTDIDDPEKLGRLKVRIINRDSSDYETGFIRVMTPMTGKEWGTFCFPEVGDEVLVAFNQGDINRPYVLGSLWNKNYKPPTTIENQKNDIRMIKTKSGHEIVFDDTSKKEKIDIKTPKELTVTLEDEKEKITIKDKQGKNIITIDSKNGEISVISDNKISLKSGNSSLILDSKKNSVNLESNQSLNISSQQISIKAKSTLELQAGGSLNVKSSGPAVIKGATVKIN